MDGKRSSLKAIWKGPYETKTELGENRWLRLYYPDGQRVRYPCFSDLLLADVKKEYTVVAEVAWSFGGLPKVHATSATAGTSKSAARLMDNRLTDRQSGESSRTPNPAATEINSRTFTPMHRVTISGLAFLLTMALLVLTSSTIFAQSNRNRDAWKSQCRTMVDLYVEAAGVKDQRVLAAMRATPRHEFMPSDVQRQAYQDAGVSIGEAQTISSPFIVAYMTESIEPRPNDKVLEIGTGSGYQAAILSPLVQDVYSIEIIEKLGQRAARTLKRLKYDNVHTKIGDGFLGWPEHAPFDKIIVTCSPERIPKPLVDQLADGGIMVIPVGERYQQSLVLLKKSNGKLETQSLRPTLFVPMTGNAEQLRRTKPDHANPALLNADFELEPAENGFVKGWYYQRLLSWQEDKLAPGGSHFVTFENSDPGRAAHLMQGFPVDGRLISEMQLSGYVKYADIVAGPERGESPMIAVSFYDQARRDLGTAIIGPFRGTDETWRKRTSKIRVPDEARDAILRIGLFGATGNISFDKLQIRAVRTQ